MFHRQFPDIKISSSLLQREYKKLGIKFKFIQRGKKQIDFNDNHYKQLFKEMISLINKTRDE